MKRLTERILIRLEGLLDWLEWKLKLRSRFSYTPHEEGEVLARYGSPQTRVEVLDVELRGEPYAVHVARTDEGGNYLCDVTLSYREALVLMEALQEATRFLGGLWGPRRLPIVPLLGKWYFLDERLGELRNVEIPHERLAFRAG